MSDDLPEPLAGPEVDCRGLDFMPLEVARLRDSELVAYSTGDEFKAAVLLWAKAWSEVPSGSLPNDNRPLARAVAMSEREFLRVREMALRGFILCADGRLYHPLICDLAEKASKMRRDQAERANSRWAKERAKSADKSKAAKSPRKSAGDAAAYPAEMLWTGTGTEKSPVSKETDVDDVARLFEEFDPATFDDDALAWRMAVAVFVTRGAIAEKKARAIIGRVVSAHGLRPLELARVAAAAWKAGTQSPEGYFQKAAAGIVERRGQANGHAKATEAGPRGVYDAIPLEDQRRYLEFRQRAGEQANDFYAWDRTNYGFPPSSPLCKFDPALLREFGIEAAPRPGA